MTRWQVPVVLGAVAVGTVTGLVAEPGDAAERLVVPALVALLTLTFTGVNVGAFTEAIRPHPRVGAASLALNFAWTPVLAGLLGWALLEANPDVRLGLVMLLVTPCTDWYLVFTGSARGNLPLAAALLPVNLVLQLLLLPLFVTVLTGAAADIPVARLVGSVAVVLGVPLGIAALVRLVAARAHAQDRLDAALERPHPVGLALLALAITAIFAAHVRVVTDNPDAFLLLLGPLAVFFSAGYLLAGTVSRALGLAHPERVTLTMTTLARNSPMALAVATAAFPDRPLVAVALVIGPLIELPVLALTARRLSRRAVAEPPSSATLR